MSLPSSFSPAATVLDNVQRIFFIVPVFSVVLVILALGKGLQATRHAYTVYAYIASLAALSALAGALGSYAKAEAVVQNLLSLFLAIPVLNLPATHSQHHRLCQFELIIRTIHTSLLVIFLSSATFLAFLRPFFSLPQAPHSVPVLRYLPEALFTAYTLLALLRLCFHLAQILKQSRLNLLRPTSIDIHVTTQSTSAPIPINLSSTFSSCIPYKPFNQEIKGIDIELGEQRGGHHKVSSIDSAISIVTEAELSTPAVKSSLPPPDIAHRSTQSGPLYLPNQQQNYLHTRNVLFFLFVAQLFILAAYTCFLCTVPTVFALNPALTKIPTGVLAPRILQVIFKVISVISTMSASFLHAYNTHIGALSSGLSSFPLSKSLSFSKRGSEKRTVTRSASCAAASMDTSATGQSDTVNPFPPVPSKTRTAARFTTRRAAPTAEVLPPAVSRARGVVLASSQRPVSAINYEPSKLRVMSDQTLLEVWDGEGRDEKSLVNSYSLGSLKSASGGSEETQDSDRTRVEGEEPQFRHNTMQRKPSGRRVSGDHAVHIRKHASLRETTAVKKLFKFGWRGRSATMSRRGSVDGGNDGGCGEGRREFKGFFNTKKERHRVQHEMLSTCTASDLTTKLSTPATPANSEAQMPTSSIFSNREETRELKKNTGPTPAHLGSGSNPPSAFTFECTDSCTHRSTLVPDVSALGYTLDSGPPTTVPTTKKKLVWKGPDSASSNVSDGTLVSTSLRPVTTASKTCWKGDGDGMEADREIIDGDGCNKGRIDSTSETVKEDGLELDEAVSPSRGGLNLKRSFKLGVGRTLGPGLTLAAATGALEELVLSAPNAVLFPDATAKSGDCADKNHDIVGQIEEPRRVGRREVDGVGSGMNTPSRSRLTKLPLMQTLQVPTPRPTPEKKKSRFQTLSKAKMEKTVALPPTNITPHSRDASMKPSPSTKAGSVGTSPGSSHTYAFPMIFRGSFSSEGRRSLSSAPSPPTSPLNTRSFAHSISGQPETYSSPPSTSTSRRRSATSPLRLSAITIESVKSAFAGVVGGVLGSRTSTTASSPQTSNMNKHPSLNAITSGTSFGTAAHGTGAFEGGEIMIMGDSYGDFMDLRDPFASPPPTKMKRNPNGYVREGLMNVDSLDDGHGACYEDVFVGSTGGHSRGEFGRRMSAWGKLPMPMKEYSSSAGGISNRSVGLNHALPSTTSVGRSGGGQRRNAAHPIVKSRRSRKERRTRKSSMLGVVKNTKVGVSGKGTKVLGDEELNFDIEEALLAQKLLKRLDDDGWEGRV